MVLNIIMIQDVFFLSRNILERTFVAFSRIYSKYDYSELSNEVCSLADGMTRIQVNICYTK